VSLAATKHHVRQLRIAAQNTGMNPEPFAQLANALRERLSVIADRELYARDPAGHLEKLKAASERIAALSAALPRPLDGDFAHYLQRASYEKALAWLDAREARPHSP
jgi:hypothetical protein